MLGLTLLWSALSTAAPAVRDAPAQLVLGVDPGFELTVDPGGDGRLRSHASLGTLTPLSSAAERPQRFRWTPPSSKAPALTQLVFWRDEPGPPELAVVRVPLLGRTELEIDTEPSAQVRVQIGAREFGPRRASASGRVTVPVEVPPLTATAKVIAEAGGQTSSRELPLDLPPQNPLTAFITPDPLVLGVQAGYLCVLHAQELPLDGLVVELENGRAESASLPCRALFATGSPVQASVRLPAEPLAVATVRSQAVAAPVAPVEEAPARFEVAVAVGGFYAGGSNAGPMGGVTGSYRLPFGNSRPWRLELAAGFKSGVLSGRDFGLGEFDSAFHGFPIHAGARARVVERARWGVDVRVSGGLMPFQRFTRSSLQPTFDEGGLGFELLFGVQAVYRLSPRFEAFCDLRVGLSPLVTSRLRTDAGGVGLSVGSRFAAF